MNWDKDVIGSWSAVLLPATPAAAYVYVAWGRQGPRPLYVGYTAMALFRRIAGHLGRSSWVGKVRRWEFYAFDSVEAAAEAEMAAIIELNPIHNRRRTLPPLKEITQEQREIGSGSICRPHGFRHAQRMRSRP